MCRPAACGVPGQSFLSRTFLERAVNPEFRRSLYAAALFNSEVLGEWCGAGVPPSLYYNQKFFDTLRYLHQNTSVHLPTASTKQLYQALLQQVLFTPATENSPATLHPVRVESLHHTVNWSDAWRLVSLPGLPSDLLLRVPPVA